MSARDGVRAMAWSFRSGRRTSSTPATGKPPVRTFRAAFMRRWPSALAAEALPRRNTGGVAMRRLAAAFAFLLCAGLCASRGAIASGGGDRELQVEAAFLVNFVRYTDWPPGRLGPAGAPYIVSVIGSEDDASDIAAV